MKNNKLSLTIVTLSLACIGVLSFAISDTSPRRLLKPNSLKAVLMKAQQCSKDLTQKVVVGLYGEKRKDGHIEADSHWVDDQLVMETRWSESETSKHAHSAIDINNMLVLPHSDLTRIILSGLAVVFPELKF